MARFKDILAWAILVVFMLIYSAAVAKWEIKYTSSGTVFTSGVNPLNVMLIALGLLLTFVLPIRYMIRHKVVPVPRSPWKQGGLALIGLLMVMCGVMLTYWSIVVIPCREIVVIDTNNNRLQFGHSYLSGQSQITDIRNFQEVSIIEYVTEDDPDMLSVAGTTRIVFNDGEVEVVHTYGGYSNQGGGAILAQKLSEYTGKELLKEW